jgi:methanogenic corrinoid protein MtbC1
MSQALLQERLLETLIAGDREGSRRVLRNVLSEGVPPERILSELCWPAHETIERLFRADQMTVVAYNLATRLLRSLVDQAAAGLSMQPRNGRTIFACCGPKEGEELAGQMAADLMEAGGYDVTFAGGGLPSDEILAQVNERRPDFLVLFSNAATDLPGIRQIIDSLKEVGASPNTKIVVGGGVFNRAEGLAEELGIDLNVASPLQLVELLCGEQAAKLFQPQRKKTTRRTAAAA